MDSFEPVILPGRASQLLARRRPPPVIQDDSKPFKLGCDYAKEYLDKEEELYKVITIIFEMRKFLRHNYPGV